MRDSWGEPEPSMRSHPALRYIVLVYVALGILLAGMILLVALDDANALYYIDAFQTLLSWPVLAFSLVMIVLLIFHRDLANVFKGYYISRVGRDAVHFEPKPQPDPPANERPILPSDDVAAQPVPQPAPEITDNDAYLRGYDDGWKLGVTSANEQIETWEHEANHWWHRYLAIFLTPVTREILRAIGRRPMSKVDLRLRMENAREWERISREPGLFDLAGALRLGERLPPLSASMLDQALSVLDRYDLIQRDGSDDAIPIHITDDGRAFLTFLNSPEGEEFVREALISQSAIPTL